MEKHVMDLETEILQEHSRHQADRIASWIGSDRKRFAALMKLFLKGDWCVTQRSAWVVSICADRHPALIRPHLKAMIKRMQEEGVHNAVPRNMLRILQNTEIPRALQGRVAGLCFEHLASATAPVAVKALSMSVVARIARTEPELQRELRLVIEQQLPFAGAAVRARARHLLRALGASNTGPVKSGIYAPAGKGP